MNAFTVYSNIKIVIVFGIEIICFRSSKTRPIRRVYQLTLRRFFSVSFSLYCDEKTFANTNKISQTQSRNEVETEEESLFQRRIWIVRIQSTQTESKYGFQLIAFDW